MDDSPWDAIFVGPTCHVQTADKRFGPHVLPDIRAFVYSTFTTSFDDDDDDDDDDDNDDDDNDDDDLLGDLGDLDDMGVVGAGGGASTANNNDDLSDLNVPFEFLEGYNMPNDAMSDAGDHAHDLEAGGEHPTFPKVARVRSNLTCLSQRYNLYFAAYQDKIHVFQPQKAPQILPPPCLVLHPPRSRAAQFVGGTIDQMFGHQVNHIIAGDFGDLEILLMCYDDGDVVAYYTHLIAYAIQQTATGRHQHHHHPQHHHHHHPPPHSHGHHHATAAAAAGRAAPVRPFFVDNVGLSAWGLAIHKESRLLAVSCNRHDVTVFAFSLSSSGSGTGTRDGYWADPASSPQVWSGQTALELERHFRSRTRNWRIVLPLGPEGNNIPSIAFVDDEEGNADKIAAVDIVGNTWILNIWQIGGFPALYPPTPSRGADNPRYRGWSVLVLPYSSFRRSGTVWEALGLPEREVLGFGGNAARDKENGGVDQWLDVTCRLYRVPDNAADVRVFLRQRHGHRYVMNHMARPEPPRSALPVVPPPAAAAAEPVNATDWSDPLDSDDDDDDDDDDEEDSEGPEPYHFYESNGPDADHPAKRWVPLSKVPGPVGSTIDLAAEERQGFRLSRTIVPGLGQTPPVRNLTEFVSFVAAGGARKGNTHGVDLRRAAVPRHLSSGFALLRATCADVELQPLDGGGGGTSWGGEQRRRRRRRPRPGLVCKDVLVAHNGPRNVPWDMHPNLCERISMAAHVPELGLVVLGSLSGRVALLSLTRVTVPPPSPLSTTAAGDEQQRQQPRQPWTRRLRYGFRVDHVLPRKREDRLRPGVALHGMAISPVPDPKADGLRLCREEAQAPASLASQRRYRLILHYMDHTILMYDIERRSPDGDLIIF